MNKTNILIDVPADKTFWLFPVFIIMNKAAINICVYLFIDVRFHNYWAASESKIDGP